MPSGSTGRGKADGEPLSRWRQSRHPRSTNTSWQRLFLGGRKCRPRGIMFRVFGRRRITGKRGSSGRWLVKDEVASDKTSASPCGHLEQPGKRCPRGNPSRHGNQALTPASSRKHLGPHSRHLDSRLSNCHPARSLSALALLMDSAIRAKDILNHHQQSRAHTNRSVSQHSAMMRFTLHWSLHYPPRSHPPARNAAIHPSPIHCPLSTVHHPSSPIHPSIHPSNHPTSRLSSWL